MLILFKFEKTKKMSSTIKPIGKLDKNLSKNGIESLAIDDIKGIIAENKFDLLKVYVELKRYSVYLESLINEIKTPALQQAQKLNNKKIELENATVFVTKRTVFDFSNDIIWAKLNSNFVEIKTKMHEHQELLKQMETATSEYVDEQTGEVFTLSAPTKKEEFGLTVRI